MRRPYNILTSFLDTFLNILLGFFVLLIFAILLINPEAKNKDIELHAEFLITMEWDRESEDDVDLFVKAPTGQITYYGNRDTPLLNLDRDDRGMGRGDKTKLEDGTILRFKDNWEHVTIRKDIPGEFIVNIFMYTLKSTHPITVNIKVEKLNPYKVVISRMMTLTNHKEELTAVRFRSDGRGNISNISTVSESLVIQVEGAE